MKQANRDDLAQLAPPLWRQLQACAGALQMVVEGRNHSQALSAVAPALRPAAQALLFAVLRHWETTQAVRNLLVKRAPSAPVNALLCTGLGLLLLGNEAMYMLSEGVASAEDIDTSLRMAFNHPMGPLELGDLTGWDTRLAVLQYLHQTLGEKFRPCPLIIKLVKAGRHGRKTGRGIYEYDDKGAKIPNSGVRPF